MEVEDSAITMAVAICILIGIAFGSAVGILICKWWGML